MDKAKIEKELPEFVSEVAGLDRAALEQRVVNLAGDNKVTCDAMEADEDLQDAKARAREMGAPYRDAKKVIRMKTEYILTLLEGK